MGVVADEANLRCQVDYFQFISVCLYMCLSTQRKTKSWNTYLGFFGVFFFPSKSKQHDNICARSIQIPSGRRQNTPGSECTSHPVARSISTFGPLEEDEKGNQKISHIIPTGSLPATLQGPTVCSFSIFNLSHTLKNDIYVKQH